MFLSKFVLLFIDFLKSSKNTQKVGFVKNYDDFYKMVENRLFAVFHSLCIIFLPKIYTNKKGKSCTGKNHFLGRKKTENFDFKKSKMTKFKANFRLVKGDNSAQITSIDKTMAFICKNMSNAPRKISTKYS
jgi:hypothetical protein